MEWSIDEGVEDDITDSQALRVLLGMDLSREAAPDAMKRGKLKAVSEEGRFGQLLGKLESLITGIRFKVEQPFHIVKNLFRHKKVHYKGQDKNTEYCT